MPRTVGVDLGASYSLVAYVDKVSAEAKCVPGPYGDTLCPSIVGLDADGGIIVGAPARRRSLSHPDRGIESVKHLMGRGGDGLADFLRTKLSLDPDSRDVVRVRLGECFLTLPEISAFIIRELKMWAEVFLGEIVERAIIAVPACFDEGQRRATNEAAMLAGLEVLRMVNEPVAAALAYGLHERRRGYVAVYDLGGTRFEISVLKLIPGGDGGIYHVISTKGDVHLGGDNLDEALLAITREEIRMRHGVDVESDPQLLQSLRRALVQAKHELSFEDRVMLEIPLPNRSLYLRDILRAEFDELARPILERTMEPVRMALADAKIVPAEIDDVVLVGGSTRLPLVRRMLTQFFGRRPRAEINPDEVVALGAAIQASILESGLREAEVESSGRRE
jgi:molecular chaperone DnaK (HSP70)